MASKDTPARDVLSGLPATRPQRRSARRDGAARARTSAAEVAAAPAAKPKAPAAAKEPKARAAAKPKARAAAKPKAAAPSKVPPAGYATPRPPDSGSGGPELISTAVQAAGELAQIGLGIGVRKLRGALSRLPKP
jgi:hypothetical protein